jgi:hypothetical protein
MATLPWVRVLGKRKMKLYLGLIKHYFMKTYRGVEV